MHEDSYRVQVVSYFAQGLFGGIVKQGNHASQCERTFTPGANFRSHLHVYLVCNLKLESITFRNGSIS